MSSIRALRSFIEPKVPGTGTLPRFERCELCSLPVSREHQHLIDPATRDLLCTCDGCAVLFDFEGVTRLRRVPRDVRLLRDFSIRNEAWEKLLIPIQLAFLYKSSYAGRVVALYPSPAGVTESLLELEAWGSIAAAEPRLADLREDIEALLVNRLKDRREYFIAPIDRCFELVGLLRRHWRGFTGGNRAWREVELFFDQLREKA